MGDSIAMKFDDLPWTRPNTLFAVGAAFFDDGNLRLHQFDGIFGADADTAAAEIALPRDNINHQLIRSWHRFLNS